MKLNKQQEEAVNCKENVIRVVAGAGSGKTRVLTERIKQHLREGVAPEKILAITFTNKAANEMKQRVGNDKVNISTIHSLCVKILRQEFWTSSFRILDTDEQKDVMKEIYEKNEINEKIFKLNETLSKVLERKLHRLDDDFEPPTKYEVPINVCYPGYVNALNRMIAMDFDDLIINTAEKLREEEIKKRWSEKFEYVLVDEFQDVDNLQYEIIKDLCTVHKNLFVVGDGDQMIYTWRGAEERIFNDFDKDFPDCKTIILNQNYRSTGNILNAANTLIHNNVKRIDKDLFTETESGTNIRIIEFNDEKEEATTIVNEIIANKVVCDYKDNAILYRANYLSKTIERELNKQKIPYVIYGGFKFYERKEVKDMIAYLKFLEYGEDLDLKRIINVPARKIGQAKIKAITDIAQQNSLKMFDVLTKGLYKSSETDDFIDLINALKKENYEDIIPLLLDKTNYLHTLDTDDNVENVQALVEEVKMFKDENPSSTLSDYLADVTLFADTLKTKDSDRVNLMTIHAAKGLEFKNVYVIGMTEGKFPKQNYDFDEEERRLAYVAITRAEENLTLCSEKRGYSGFNAPSAFISELGGFTQKAAPKEGENNNYRRRNYWEYS